MNIQSLSRKLNQKYQKDIDTSAGKVGPYYFVMEPTNQANLIRISFNVLNEQEVLSELQEKMSIHRSIGRDGIRFNGFQLIIECKVGGLDDEEELATILESVGNVLYHHEIQQVDANGVVSDNLGVFRIGTKLEIQSDTDVDDITIHSKERFKNSNQSRLMAYLKAFGIFIAMSPLYILVLNYEPSVMGFVFFSYAVLIGMFKKSLQVFLVNWTPNKTDLIILLVMFLLSLYMIRLTSVIITMISVFRQTGMSVGYFEAYFILFQALFPESAPIMLNSAISLAFAMAFNYHIVRSLLDVSSTHAKPVKRSIHRVL